MQKKKVLVVNEAHFISSGFGNIGKYLIPRLVNSGKYEIAEFASYGTIEDKCKYNIQHKYYANAVHGNDPRHASYKSKPTHDFGEWRFDRVILDFKPDVVITLRDYWMDSYIRFSPYRNFFHWAWMTTYDSAPNDEEWIDTYQNVDSLITYTDWAAIEIGKQSSFLNLKGAIPPGVDTNTFKPVPDKIQHRREMGFYEDSMIFGTVMRNQKRKLYPDLFKAFKEYLTLVPKSIAQKSYLYIHTSYPDQGWDIPGLLKNSGISHKVLFTYACKECRSVFASFFQDARGVCPSCRSSSAMLPGVSNGIGHEQLAQVYNVMDGYIQYSISEGIGLSSAEAGACGIPTFNVDATGMKEYIEHTDSEPLKVQREFLEFESHSNRVYPDNSYLAQKMAEFAMLPQVIRNQKGENTKKKTVEHFNWDTIAKRWEGVIDNAGTPKKKWDSPPELLAVKNIPENLSNEQFVHLLLEMCGKGELQHTLTSMNLVRDLVYGASMSGRMINPISREEMAKRFIAGIEAKNMAELARCGKLPLMYEDYIVEANK